MNLLLLHRFAREAADRLRGATVGTPSWYRPVLCVPWSRERERGHLVAILGSPGPFVLDTSGAPFEGAKAPAALAALGGADVRSVDAAPGDRILRLRAERDDGTAPVELLLHLYGSAGRAELRRDGKVIDVVGRRGPGGRPGAPASIVDIDPAALDAAVAAGGPGAVAGLEPELAAAFTKDGSLDAAGLAGFRDDVLAGRGRFALAVGRSLHAAVPVPPPPGDGGEAVYASAVAACEAVGGTILDEARRAILERMLSPLRRATKANRSLLANLRADLGRAADAEGLRREAETLAAYQSRVTTGAASVDLPDPYEPDRTVHIVLDPALPVREQIDRRFHKAAKLARSETHVRRRIELVERELGELEAAVHLIESMDSFKGALMRLVAAAARFGLEPPAPAPRTAARAERAGGRRERLPFRRFSIDERWFVLVGRSNADNDALTFHHAAPTDLWLHAQNVPGSHVVLKSTGGAGEPPRAIVERAAAVAAHFSKARHSRLVPVIYTQRRYVRKFRGAQPGQVVCQREKMVMVEPRLPEAPATGE